MNVYLSVACTSFIFYVFFYKALMNIFCNCTMCAHGLWYLMCTHFKRKGHDQRCHPQNILNRFFFSFLAFKHKLSTSDTEIFFMFLDRKQNRRPVMEVKGHASSLFNTGPTTDPWSWLNRAKPLRRSCKLLTFREWSCPVPELKQYLFIFPQKTAVVFWFLQDKNLQ